MPEELSEEEKAAEAKAAADKAEAAKKKASFVSVKPISGVLSPFSSSACARSILKHHHETWDESLLMLPSRQERHVVCPRLRTYDPFAAGKAAAACAMVQKCPMGLPFSKANGACSPNAWILTIV